MSVFKYYLNIQILMLVFKYILRVFQYLHTAYSNQAVKKYALPLITVHIVGLTWLRGIISRPTTHVWNLLTAYNAWLKPKWVTVY